MKSNMTPTLDFSKDTENTDTRNAVTVAGGSTDTNWCGKMKAWGKKL